MSTKRRSAAAPSAASIAILVVFVLLVSMCVDCSPTSTAYPNTDSGVFRYIGLHILQGQMPYRDIFDHKGPLMYLINAFAAGITPGSEWGLFITEVAAMVSAALLTYFTCLRFSSDRVSLCASLIAYGALAASLSGGNYVEQFALPFTALALLCLSSYFTDGALSRLDCLLVGVSGGAVFLLRPNLLGVWAVFCIAIVIFMVRDGQVRAMLGNVAFALIGFVCLCAPCVLWVAIGGAFPDFIDLYFGFNMEYARTLGHSDMPAAMLWMLSQPTLALSIVACAALTALKSEPGRRFWGCLLVSLLLVVAVLSMSGRLYDYYLMGWVPLVAAPFAGVLEMVVRFAKSRRTSEAWKVAAASGAVACAALLCLVPNLAIGWEQFTTYETECDATNPDGPGGIVAAIDEVTSPDDKIIVCDQHCWAYLESDRSAATRYIFQPEDTRLEIRESIIYDDIQNNRPKAVFVPSVYGATEYLHGMPGYSLYFSNERGDVYVLDSAS